MPDTKTKSIASIERKMTDVPSDSLRYQVMNSAKNFKTSWIELGQALYAVWKDKSYKEWGYNNFDSYSAKEIGIRKQTALKLLRSYYFLEKEEPRYLSQDYRQEAKTASVPNYEAVDALRLANNKKLLDRADYEQLKKNVLEEGRDVREVKKDLTSLMKQRQELLPEEAREQKKLALLKRFVSLLKSIREELKVSKMLPMPIVKEVDSLITRIESELPRKD